VRVWWARVWVWVWGRGGGALGGDIWDCVGWLGGLVGWWAGTGSVSVGVFVVVSENVWVGFGSWSLM